MSETPAYGWWSLAIVNSLVFLIFAFSFAWPRGARDWRSFGAFAAFIVALFTEMYGFPLTIFLLSGWLGSRYPGVDFYSHDAGHLWHTLLQLPGDAHFDPLHIASLVLLILGFSLLAAAWKVLHAAQQSNSLATTGPYARIRHPQYVGFVIIMIAFLVQWPTLLTLIMFPVLVFMYVRLARIEERDAVAQFGVAYSKYAARPPAFIPRLGRMNPAKSLPLQSGRTPGTLTIRRANIARPRWLALPGHVQRRPDLGRSTGSR